MTITDRSKALLLELAKDAGNWSGQPMISPGANVATTKEDRGNITQLKRAGLITTFVDRNDTFVQFTPEGKGYLLNEGIDLPDWY